jgi:hypothetical protein
MRRDGSWPSWKKVLAYGVLAVVAAVSIWFIDSRAVERKVDVGSNATTRP